MYNCTVILVARLTGLKVWPTALEDCHWLTLSRLLASDTNGRRCFMSTHHPIYKTSNDNKTWQRIFENLKFMYSDVQGRGQLTAIPVDVDEFDGGGHVEGCRQPQQAVHDLVVFEVLTHISQRAGRRRVLLTHTHTLIFTYMYCGQYN